MSIAEQQATISLTHRAQHVKRLGSDIVAPEVWDRTIATFDEVCQEQLHTFARARWPNVRHEPVLFRRDGEIVGGTLMMIQPLPLRVSAIAVAKWAPMLANAEHPQRRDIHQEMVETLVDDYAVRRGMMLSILPRASLGAVNEEYEYLMARGFSRGSELGFPNRYIVDLRLSDDEQRRSFLQKWRYHLNKAEKAGLSFEHAPAERLGEFDALYGQMLDRKKFSDHSAYETLPALMAMADERLRPELFFVRHGGEVIAGAVIFKAGERAVYLYGATTEGALPLRAGYFMQWNIVRWLRDNTPARWYDLGGTDGFQGLHQFKKGLVGDRGVIQPVPPVANYAARWWPRLVGKAAFFARDGVQKLRREIDRMRSDRATPDQKRSDAESPG